MNKFLKELKTGAIISLLVFVPYLTIVYLFVLWNVAQTNNLTESDFSVMNVKIKTIGQIKVDKIKNRHHLQTFYTSIHSTEPNANWRVDGLPNVVLQKGDSITVKYQTKQLKMVLDKTFSGKLQRFFSTYGNEVLIYQLTKNNKVIIRKPINEYDEGTTNRGSLFMSVFTILFIYLLSRLVKYLKAKNMWFHYGSGTY